MNTKTEAMGFFLRGVLVGTIATLALCSQSFKPTLFQKMMQECVDKNGLPRVTIYDTDITFIYDCDYKTASTTINF